MFRYRIQVLGVPTKTRLESSILKVNRHSIHDCAFQAQGTQHRNWLFVIPDGVSVPAVVSVAVPPRRTHGTVMNDTNLRHDALDAI